MELKSACVFCGSSKGVHKDYMEMAGELGKDFARHGVRLVYGGGGIGLMGQSAKSCHEAGGSVLGIMPAFLRKREILYDDVETRVVETMHERKAMMFEESDAFVVLPGGIGTLEEIVELMSWRRLDLHFKPTVFVDTRKFWQPYFQTLRHAIDEGFAPDWLMDSFITVDTAEEVIPAIQTALKDIQIRRTDLPNV